jgi:hypothetical protein
MLNWIRKTITARIRPTSYTSKFDPWVVYKENHLYTQGNINTKHYPFKELLSSEGLYAYRLTFLVSEAETIRIRSAIKQEFPLLTNELYFRDELVNSQNLHVHVGLRKEFNGDIVEILTNSVALLNALDELELKTLPPWVTFPDFDPVGFHSLQGNIEHWWEYYFADFWCSLGREERLDYIQNAPYRWKELFMNRFMDYRSC